MDDRADILVSIILVVSETDDGLAGLIRDLHGRLDAKVRDHEIIIIDNASQDGTVARIERLIEEVPNIHLYSLARACDRDVAVLAGIENSIGDFVITMLPIGDQLPVVSRMIDQALAGAEIVLGRSDGDSRHHGWLYGLLAKGFFGLYRRLTGIAIPAEASNFRLMSRGVVNYLLQTDAAHIMFQALPAIAAFKSAVIPYEMSSGSQLIERRSMGSGIHKALSVVLSTTAFPTRLLSLLSVLAGLLNLVYAGYVVIIAIFKEGVAEGWITLSLQISGMFFLVSIILALLSEYIVRIFEGSLRRPLYLIAREKSSAVLSRNERLNILHNLAPRHLDKTGTS
jgi:glycosyltransferase involved in cell wall biosynthesis